MTVEPVTDIVCPASCAHDGQRGACVRHGQIRRWTGSPGISAAIPYCNCPPEPERTS